MIGLMRSLICVVTIVSSSASGIAQESELVPSLPDLSGGPAWQLKDRVQLALKYAEESKFEWAFPIFKEHAEAGNLDAMYHLAIMYHYGEGMEPDQKAAFAWASRAAKGGQAAAQNELGVYYLKGVGTTKRDKKEAVRWFRASAEQGLALGQRNLALSYLEGEGAPKDRKLALEWFKKSAEQEDEISALSLGEMYERGQGTTQDFREAFRWYARAALSSTWLAQLRLGKFYLEGRGVERDLVKAHVWFTSAAGENGTHVSFNTGAIGVEAQKLLKKITKSLSPAQIEQANLLLKTCHEERGVERAMTACGLQ